MVAKVEKKLQSAKRFLRILDLYSRNLIVFSKKNKQHLAYMQKKLYLCCEKAYKIALENVEKTDKVMLESVEKTDKVMLKSVEKTDKIY